MVHIELLIQAFISIFFGISVWYTFVCILKKIHQQYRQTERGHFSVSKYFFTKIDKKSFSKLWYVLGNGKNIRQYIVHAGLGSEWTLQRFLILKSITIQCACVYSFLIYILKPERSMNQFFILAIMLFISYYWVELYLKQRIFQRQRSANKTFTLVLDLVRLQITAGANLESTFRNLSTHLTGVWGDEMKYALFLMDCGIPFNEALLAIDTRLGIADFHRIVLALKQAQTLGTPLKESLTIQANMMRMRKRQKAEELARTAGVKISIPLVFFIFPALLIIYLGPAILHLKNTL